MSLKEKANALRRDVDRLLAAGGDMAIPVLTAINVASDVFPPLKGPASAALFIFSEVQKFKSDKEEWKEFGKYVVDIVADVLAAIEPYDTSTEEAKPWLENVKKLDSALKQIIAEIVPMLAKMKKRHAVTNYLSLLKHPGRIDDFKKVLDKALTSFQLRTNLTTGAILTNIANNQSHLESDSVLSGLRYPTIAHHDPDEACLEGTRTDLANDIMTWVRNVEDGEKQVMLLTAVAGAGKTSVAHSIAEKCESEGLLLLTFFFKAGEQSQPDHLFSSMARSLATRDHSYRASVISILKEDPALMTASFTVQFEKLVAKPLRLRGLPAGGPLVVIVDALDECEPRDFERLAEILRKEVPKLPSTIKFFVTSRQTHLVDRLLSPNFPIDRLGIDILNNANKQDCSVYIRAQLRCLKDGHSGRGDEFEEDSLVQDLSEKAGGLFIWISTVFRCVRLAKKPRKTLNKLLNTGAFRSMDSPEGVMGTLYTAILEKCDWEDEDFVHDYPIVMGAILIAEQPLSIAAWDAILSPFLNSSIHDTLVELAPLLLGIPHSDTPIRIIHQSFRDFLMGQIGPKSLVHHHYTVDTREVNAKIALRCTEILNKDLCCVEGLGLIEDLPEKDELPRISQEMQLEQLRYSCRYIVHHLKTVLEPQEVLSGSVLTFMNQHVARWVEVCVRTEGYISVSSFPKWAKLNVDRNSKKDIHKLIQVLDKVRQNLAFFSRFQEAHELAKDSVTLCRCLVSADSESYIPYLARSLNGLDVSLNDLGHHSEALPVIEESVNLWRELVAIDPMLYTPDLARSLSTLMISLHNLGLHSEALPMIEESVKLWRELVAIDPMLYTPDLAQSLHNFYVSLENLGRYSEAHPIIEESVTLRRALVAIDPTSYTPNLARSLHNLSVSLDRLGRHSEALPVTEECVKLWRELIAVHPMSYIPHLARSLNCLKISLDNLGRYSEALSTIKECVKLWRKLVSVHPTSYNPDLARSLHNLALSFDYLNCPTEAVPFIKESISLWRSLHITHPTSYAADLAWALRDLSRILSRLGHYAEAFDIEEEARLCSHQLRSEYPDIYANYLRGLYADMAAPLEGLGRGHELADIRTLMQNL
ncbi:uncharacterized protein EI90DRAFT_3118771 [Cantharellus anzutake]|uniref:uncharacterized protein n=1 Tax=Cantharellus anzutake TaxID=1750568 RepID=UPI001904A331|nr:uncharacterized protein EI90DRAFT_3118771 [Cantharellus anzutake]KAF8337326.1 hypothetical protein EI90DRAFT_3118771 [Cantharellus anzutake]